MDTIKKVTINITRVEMETLEHNLKATLKNSGVHEQFLDYGVQNILGDFGICGIEINEVVDL